MRCKRLRNFRHMRGLARLGQIGRNKGQRFLWRPLLYGAQIHNGSLVSGRAAYGVIGLCGIDKNAASLEQCGASLNGLEIMALEEGWHER